MIITLNTKKYGKLDILLDDEDYQQFKDTKLYISFMQSNKNFYAMTAEKKYIHRLIMNAPKGLVVDHINHNTLDNRRCNLRICTPSENRLNSKRFKEDSQKLSTEEIKYILTSKDSNNALAKRFNVSNCLINNIRCGYIYTQYCPEIPRHQAKKAKMMPDFLKKEIKNKVINSTVSLYKLAKILNMPESRLYRIKNGKIWKNI